MKAAVVGALVGVIVLAACGGDEPGKATAPIVGATDSISAATTPTTPTSSTGVATIADSAAASTPPTDGYASANEAADEVGVCESFVDEGPEDSAGDYPKAINEGTCTLADGTQLGFSVYASKADRQAAETIGKALASAFLASDARLLYAAGENLLVAQGGDLQMTTEGAEKVMREVAEELDLTVGEIVGKSA